MLIAKSRERESASEDGVIWWKEYRAEPDQYRGGFRVDVRYLCRVGEKVYARVEGRVALFTNPDHCWTEGWGRGKTLAAAIWDVISDSDFRAAESLAPVHAEAVAKLNAAVAAGEVRRQAELRLQKARLALEEFKVDQQRLFNKRHGGKAGKEFEAAFVKTQKRLKPEFDRLMADVVAAREAVEKLPKA